MTSTTAWYRTPVSYPLFAAVGATFARRAAARARSAQSREEGADRRVLRFFVLPVDTRRHRLQSSGAAFVLAADARVCRVRARRGPAVATRLHPCASTEGPTDAYCGGLEVYEDRAAGSRPRGSGSRIVVLPSVSSDVHADPLLFLAGGPGQAAAQMATLVQPMFRKPAAHARHRAGRSARHRQVEPARTARRRRFAARSHRARRACHRNLKSAWPATTPIRALHDRPSRWTISTMSAPSSATTDQHLRRLVRHACRARLPAPARRPRARRRAGRRGADHMRLPLFFPRDPQRALDLLIDDCAAPPRATRRYPEPARALARADGTAG